MSKQEKHGSMYERRPGVWMIRVTSGRRADGKPRTVNETFYGTEAEAIEERERLYRELSGNLSLRRGVTLDYYWSKVFVPIRSRVLKHGTISAYTSSYTNHIQPTLGDRDISTITHLDIQLLVASLYPPATSRKAYVTLRAILNAAVADGVIEHSPIRGRIRLPRKQETHTEAWTPIEVSEALYKLRGNRFEPLVLLMAGFGLRRSEAMALTLPGDIEFQPTTDGGIRAFVTIKATYTADDGWLDETKTYANRTAAASGYVAHRMRELYTELKNLCKSVPVISNSRNGKSLRPDSVPKLWRELFAQDQPLNGMKYVTLESLRHANVTMAVLGGADDTANSMAHGHSERVAFKHYLQQSEYVSSVVADAVSSQIDPLILQQNSSQKVSKKSF